MRGERARGHPLRESCFKRLVVVKPPRQRGRFHAVDVREYRSDARKMSRGARGIRVDSSSSA